MPLFEVAILEQPTQRSKENGGAEKLIFGPVAVVAKDSQGAGILAARQLKEEVDPDRMTVLIRPFV